MEGEAAYLIESYRDCTRIRFITESRMGEVSQGSEGGNVLCQNLDSLVDASGRE
jgi:hypothetical protein